ncbi:uncharacterized protein TNCV_2850781 [Trichonephila clavipes]|nr:uncharacterized protein TNCV_2850781 [Trichonephila clavipes]
MPEPVRQVGLPYNRWRHHLSPRPQFRHGTGEEGNILQPHALLVSAATSHKTFGLTDLTSTYPCVLGEYLVAFDIETRLSHLQSDALTTRLPTARGPHIPPLMIPLIRASLHRGPKLHQ